MNNYIRESYIRVIRKIPVFTTENIRSTLFLFTKLFQSTAQLGLSIPKKILAPKPGSEEKFRQLVEVANSIIIKMNDQGQVTYFNQFAKTFFGFSKEEILGQNVVGTIVPETETTGRDLAAMIHDLGSSPERYVSNENENMCKNGERVWVAWTNKAILNNKGQVYEILCIGNDITKRKQAEEALHQSEAKYRRIIENMQDVYYRANNQGDLELINPSALQLFGYESIEEMLGLNLAKDLYANPEKRKEFLQALHNNGGRLKNYEVDLKKRDGSVITVITSSAIFFNEDGQPAGVEGFFWDITERKQVEERLRLADRAMESSINGISIVDMQGKVVYVNPAGLKMWGLEKGSEVIGRKAGEFWRSRQRALEAFELTRQEERWCGEMTAKRLDGNIFPAWVSMSLVKDTKGIATHVLGVFLDISEQKQMEEGLREMSLHDSLTKLYNRGYFEEEMKRLGDERHCPIGIIVCDIDGLKLINDTIGHIKGDEILKAAADILRKCFRKSDIMARIGGDEFAILMPKCSQEIISLCRKRIQKEVEYYNKQGSELGLSISIGHAVQYRPPVEMNSLFKRADDYMYKEKLQQSYSSRSEIVQALIKTMEARDYITNGHTDRLQDYSQHMGRILGLSKERINDLYLLGRFHDLGKVGIPDNILFKPGPLTQEEFQEMKRHCEIGHRIALSTSDLAPIADFILKHHEWWNGQGYPLGLKEKEIPLECRILAIVDAYDTMISQRPYKSAMSHQEALAELRRCSGTQFDPELVEKFISIFEKE